MTFAKLKLAILASGLVAATAAPAMPAEAPATREVISFGGPRAFTRPPLVTVADLQKMFEKRAEDLRSVLTQAGFAGKAEDLFAAVAKGEVVEKEYPAGATFSWMARRVGRKAGIVENLRYAGGKPFPGFEITFVSADTRWVMVVPKACGNLALLSSTPLPPPDCKLVAAVAGDGCITRAVTIDASGSSVSYGSIASVEASVTLPSGAKESLGPATGSQWSRSWNVPGKYAFTAVAVADSGRRSAECQAEVSLKPCPPSCALAVSAPAKVRATVSPTAYTGEAVTVDASASRVQVGEMKGVAVDVAGVAGAPLPRLDLAPPGLRIETRFADRGDYTFKAVASDSLDQVSSNDCAGSLHVIPRLGLVGDVLVGNERRWREEFPNDRSAPLVGGRFGINYMASDTFELAGLGGILFNLRDGENWSALADFEANWRGAGGFFGAGLGLFDFTHGDDFSPTFKLQGGVSTPWRVGESRVDFMVEARTMLDMLDEIDNNFVLLGGLRFRPWN